MKQSNSLPPLAAARKTQRMIGQVNALAEVQASIFDPDNRFRIVFIRAEGGMGKTRLLEETLSLVNAQKGGPFVSELIDVIDIRLHARDRFVHQLRESLRHPEAEPDFSSYDRAFDDLRIKRAAGAQLQTISEASQKAVDEFMADLKKVTAQRRVTWVIDTVEQLRFVTSEWLLDKRLLQAHDLRGRTHQWLAELVQTADLHNVTLVLAGRGEEGKPFFDRIETAINEAKRQGLQRELIDIPLQRLNSEKTRQYFATLATDWHARATIKMGDEQIAMQQIARRFEAVAEVHGDQATVLWLYTSGVPVRLALYAQLLVEGRRVPEPLRWSFSKAVAEVGTDDPAKPTPALQRRQWEIEDGFINLLFQNPTDLRARVLQVLVRTPRGVSAEQLHYVLDSPSNQDIKAWRSDPERLRELVRLMHEMKDYYLVKSRVSWADFALALPEGIGEAAALREGLQDEVYRIYAEHMAPHTDSTHAAVLAIWHTLSEAEQARYRRNREDEAAERQELYRKLRDWAAFQHEHYLALKREILEADEKQFEMQLTLDDPRTFRFKELSSVEVDRREAITEALRTFEVERIVYDLLLDPERNLNADYVDLGRDINRAHEEDHDFWVQTEMWRIVHDDNSLKFVDFFSRPQEQEWGETAVQILQRAVVQEDVSRWLKRFVLRGDLKRALEFAQAAQAAIAALPRGTRAEERAWRSWNHTLINAERQIWADYARILAAREQRQAIASLQAQIQHLKLLLAHSVDEAVIIRDADYPEHGFQASDSRPAHPALVRLRHLVSYAYNILGYGCIMLGQVQEAVRYYGQALDMIREDVGTMKVHRGYVLNNLSRALSSLGYDSIAVCLDGLQLRRELADEVPLAYSYNMLTLIYDNMGRYEDAPKLAAKAIAYFRRAGYARGLGLALTQMGESLRHLALRVQSGEMVSATPESLYTASDTLLGEARSIFSSQVQDPARLIQVNIALGSLYRDRVRQAATAGLQKYRPIYYREAIRYLMEAKSKAQEYGLTHDEVDANINIAWAQLYDKRYEETEKTTQATVQLMRERLGEEYFITKAQIPEVQSNQLKDAFWVTFDMSRLQVASGHLALIQFQEQAEESSIVKYSDRVERHLKTRADPDARQYLAKAAEAYLLGLAYARLLPPQSRAAAIVLNDLYERMKKSNRQELQDFRDAVHGLRERYPRLQATVAELDAFLHAFFGIPDSMARDENSHDDAQ